jgi:hypothetical protein
VPVRVPVLERVEAHVLSPVICRASVSAWPVPGLLSPGA